MVQVVRVMLVLAVGVALVAFALSHRGAARKNGQATTSLPSDIFTAA